MKSIEMKLPELGLLAITRPALGAGVAMLISTKMDDRQRRSGAARVYGSFLSDSRDHSRDDAFLDEPSVRKLSGATVTLRRRLQCRGEVLTNWEVAERDGGEP